MAYLGAVFFDVTDRLAQGQNLSVKGEASGLDNPLRYRIQDFTLAPLPFSHAVQVADDGG